MEEGWLVSHYQEHKFLSQAMVKRLMNRLAVISQKKFGKAMCLMPNILCIAKAAMALFPEEFPVMDILVTKERRGMLFEALQCRRREQYPALKKSSTSGKETLELGMKI